MFGSNQVQAAPSNSTSKQRTRKNQAFIRKAPICSGQGAVGCFLQKRHNAWRGGHKSYVDIDSVEYKREETTGNTQIEYNLAQYKTPFYFGGFFMPLHFFQRDNISRILANKI